MVPNSVPTEFETYLLVSQWYKQTFHYNFEFNYTVV